MKIAKDALKRDNVNLHAQNNFLTQLKVEVRRSLNIAQITSLLGQQITEGQRVKPLLSNGRRTLPHYILKEENNDTEHFHEST